MCLSRITFHGNFFRHFGEAPSDSATKRYLLFSEDSRQPRCEFLHLSTLY
jgi:hypothetical protein